VGLGARRARVTAWAAARGAENLTASREHSIRLTGCIRVKGRRAAGIFSSCVHGKDRFPAAVHSGGGLTMATTLRRFVRTAAELIAVALVALAATLLLASAAAYAVDVWVLWSKWDGSYASPNAPYKKVTATYKIDATYADRAACIHAIDAHLAVRGSIKPADGATWHVDTSELQDGKGSYWIEERGGKLSGVGVYVCLPDKVDPPGPKSR